MFPTRRIVTSGGDVFRDEYSLEFDGTDDNIRITETEFSVHDAAFSFVFWVKRNTIDADACILGHTSTANFKYLRFASNNTLSMESDTNNDLFVLTPHTTNLEWNHYVVTVSSGDTITGYQNGISIPLASGNVDGDNLTINTIGGQGENGTSNEFNGNISEIAIYNKALSAGEAKTIYNGREPYNHKEGVASGSLVGWWRMGDGLENSSGTTIYDTSSNSNNGTMTNFPAGAFNGDTP